MYFVIGADGFLGSYVIKNLLASTSEEIFAVGRHDRKSGLERVKYISCDITKRDDVVELNNNYFAKYKNNRIIYLAAYHHPDLLEQNPRIAWDVNVTSLSRFLNIAENITCLYYASTEHVYGESYNGYHFQETDVCKPITRYGRQKCVAETLVTAYGYHVIRFPFLIGPSIAPGKKHFYDTILESIRHGEAIKMFSDSYHSTLSFDTAAWLTTELVRTHTHEYPQVLNICGDEDLSKYDIGLMIANQAGISNKFIEPISISRSEGIFETRRAASTLMDNTLVKQVLGLDEIKLVF